MIARLAAPILALLVGVSVPLAAGAAASAPAVTTVGGRAKVPPKISSRDRFT